jgi:hypothetical protein
LRAHKYEAEEDSEDFENSCRIRHHEGEAIVHGCPECETGKARGLAHWAADLRSIEAKQEALMSYVQGRTDNDQSPPLQYSNDAVIARKRHIRQSYYQRKPQANAE